MDNKGRNSPSQAVKRTERSEGSSATVPSTDAKKRSRRRRGGRDKQQRSGQSQGPTLGESKTVKEVQAAGSVNAGLGPVKSEADPGLVSGRRKDTDNRADVFVQDRFDGVVGISKASLEGIPFATMTRIQSLAIPAAMQGTDVLIKAKTGHGKTLAFGVPLFECLIRSPGAQGLVIAPTRELALQTKQVFDTLARVHKLSLACFIGGVGMGQEVALLKKSALQVLIATPGRLLDHLKSAPNMLQRLVFLVLDEADRLLDEGFQRDMEQIFRLLPSNRQTILASATLPQNMAQFKHLCLRPNHVTVSAMDQSGEQTNAQLEESVLVVSLDNWLIFLYAILQETIAKNQKTMLFLQAAQEARLLALVLGCSGLYGNAAKGPQLFEIHSRLNQNQRVKQLTGFREAGGGSLLCSSDVGARGWDIDDVDCVIQLGIPSDNDTYVHRVGRTARAGTRGVAKMICFDWEAPFFFARYPRAKALESKATFVPTVEQIEGCAAMVAKANKHQEWEKTSKQGYQGFLGVHNSWKGKMKLSSEQLVAVVNRWIASLGCQIPPALKAKTLGKMQLRGTPGIREAPKEQGGEGKQQGSKDGKAKQQQQQQPQQQRPPQDRSKPQQQPQQQGQRGRK